jgi:hypothetical protein
MGLLDSLASYAAVGQVRVLKEPLSNRLDSSLLGSGTRRTRGLLGKLQSSNPVFLPCELSLVLCHACAKAGPRSEMPFLITTYLEFGDRRKVLETGVSQREKTGNWDKPRPPFKIVVRCQRTHGSHGPGAEDR